MPKNDASSTSSAALKKGTETKGGIPSWALPSLPACQPALPSVGPMTTHTGPPRRGVPGREGRQSLSGTFLEARRLGLWHGAMGPCAPLCVSPPTARRRQSRESGSQLFVLQAQTSGIQTEAAESRVSLLAHTPRLTATDFRRRRDMINEGGWSPNPHARCFFRASTEASSEIDQHTTHSSHAVWQAGQSLAGKQGIPSRPCIPLPINYHAELLSSRIWCNMRKFDQASPFPNQRRNHVAKQVTENPPSVPPPQFPGTTTPVNPRRLIAQPLPARWPASPPAARAASGGSCG